MPVPGHSQRRSLPLSGNTGRRGHPTGSGCAGSIRNRHLTNEPSSELELPPDLSLRRRSRWLCQDSDASRLPDLPAARRPWNWSRVNLAHKSELPEAERICRGAEILSYDWPKQNEAGHRPGDRHSDPLTSKLLNKWGSAAAENASFQGTFRECTIFIQTRPYRCLP